MSKIEQIENQIKELSAEDLRSLRAWFFEYDSEAWDRQFEADVTAGKLDAMARSVLDQHAAGRSTEL